MVTTPFTVRFSVRDAQTVQTALKALGNEGQAALRKVDQAALAAAGSTQRFGSSVGGVRSIVQQAGFQVGDFAVQVASGQSALVAFTQQGSQLLGVLGPIGAALGAGVAIAGAFARAMTENAEETERAKKALEDYEDALQSVNDLTLTATQNTERQALATRADTIATLENVRAQKELALARSQQREGTLRRDIETGRAGLFSRPARLAALEREAEAAAVATARLRQELDGLDEQLDAVREADPLAQVEENAKAATDQVDDLLELAKELADEEKKRTGEIIKSQREVARIEEQLDRDRERRAEKEARDAQRRAERQAELMAQPFKNAISSVQSEFSDAWFEIFREGELSFKSLADSAKDIFARLAAELVTLQFIGPQGINLVGAVGGAAGLAGGSALAGGGGGGLLAGLGLGAGAAGGGGGIIGALGLTDVLATAGSALAGATQFVKDIAFEALSFIDPSGALGVDLIAGGGGIYGALGSLGAKALGLSSGNFGIDFGLSTAGTIGGALIGGPVGAAVGGFAGQALSSLLGGRPSVGPNAGALVDIGGFGARVGAVGGDNGGDVGAAQQLGAAVAQGINAVLGAIPNAAGFAAGGNLSIGSFGSMGGFNSVVRRPGQGRLDADRNNPAARFFGNDSQAAVADAILRTFAQDRVGGVSADVAGQIQAAAAGAGSLEAFAQAIDRIIQSSEDATETLTDTGEALAAFNADIEAQILALEDPLQAELNALEAAQQIRLAIATEAGADLVQVERLSALERERVVAGSLGDINRLLADLTVGGASGLTPAVRLDAARSAFTAAQAEVAGGGAPAGLAGTVRSFIDASRAVNASGGGFGADLEAALALLRAAGATTFASGGIALGPGIIGEAGAEAAIPLDSGLRIPIAEITGGIMETGMAELVRLGEFGRLNEETIIRLLERLVSETQALRREARMVQAPRELAA